jgi:hypothetical protein
MARFLRPVLKFLEYYNDLDLLDKFAPTVLQDRSFEGAIVAVLRDHFDQWATTALREEQGVQNANVDGPADTNFSSWWTRRL